MKHRGMEQLAARWAHKIVTHQIKAIIFFIYISTIFISNLLNGIIIKEECEKDALRGQEGIGRQFMGYCRLSGEW